VGYRWLNEPQWYLWEGGFLLIGRAQGVVPRHAHHAIQIVIALDGMVAVCGQDDQWRESPGLVVKPDVVHSFDAKGALGAMVFVDPESHEGRWLTSSLNDEITMVPGERLASSASELRAFAERPLESMELGTLIQHSVRALSPGAPSARRLDDRITTVLHNITGSDELRISLESAAEMAFLSPTLRASVQRADGPPLPALRTVAEVDASHGGHRQRGDDRGRGTRRGLCRCGPSDPDVLPDGRHGPVSLDARPLRADSLAVQRCLASSYNQNSCSVQDVGAGGCETPRR
jgi:CDGSH-type Zn-finger protein